MKKSLRVLALMACIFTVSSISAGVVFEENFDYPKGTLPMQNDGWFTQWGSQSALAISDGLTFEGYPGSGVGNGVEIAVDDSNASHCSFKEITTGDVYVAFMFRAFVAYKKGYFFCLRDNKITPGDFNFNGRVSVNDSGALGLTFANNKNAQYATEALDGNKVYLVVLKYSIKDGNNNDEVSLYCLDSMVETEPAEPLIGPLTDAGKTDINPANVVLRGYAGSDYIDLMVDGIRVATSWEEAVGAQGAVETLENIENSISVCGNEVVMTSENVANYAVCDLSGRLVDAGRIFNGKVTVELEKGAYIANLAGQTRKIIIR